MTRLPLLPMAAIAVCAVLNAVLGNAHAQTQPRIQPSRDVVVTYAVDGPAADIVPGGIPGPVRLSWNAGGQRLRAEAEGRTQAALVDLRTRAGQVIDTALHVALPLKLHQGDLQALVPEGVRLTPGARAVVAGLPCTDYRFDTQQGPATICLTQDGVPLRGQGAIRGKPGTFTAQSVRYGPLPPSLFEVPPGYAALSNGQGGALAGALGALLGRGGK